MAQDIIVDRFSRRFQANLVMEGVLVGAAVGVVITCYRFVLSHMEAFLRSVIVGSVNKMLGPFLGALLVAAAFCAIGYVVSKVVDWEKDTAGSGIPQIDAEVMGRLDMNWYRVLGAKFLEGSLVAASGLSMGREGPSVQLGGMVGKGVSRSFGKERGEERLLVTCGAAAGMSAAFHALRHRGDPPRVQRTARPFGHGVDHHGRLRDEPGARRCPRGTSGPGCRPSARHLPARLPHGRRHGLRRGRA